MKKISIVIAVLNAKEFIFESLNSVKKQSHNNFECLIFDGGSKDGTIEILKKIALTDRRFRIFYKKQINFSNSLNFLIKKSKSNYIFRFDSDDIMNKFRVEKQLKFLMKGHDIVGSNVLIKRKYFSYTRKYPENNSGITAFALIKNPFAHPSVAFKKNKVPRYKNLAPIEDYNLWADCITKKKLNMINIQENLTTYRLHNNNVTKNILSENYIWIRKKICNQLMKFLKIPNKYSDTVLRFNLLKKVDFKNIKFFLTLINSNNKISKFDKYLIFKEIILNSFVYSFFNLFIIFKLNIYFKDKLKMLILIHLSKIIKI
jgi:glycosyltransferase involved in cell wall biosynthesis